MLHKSSAFLHAGYNDSRCHLRRHLESVDGKRGHKYIVNAGVFQYISKWVSQIQISCIEALPFYMPKMIIQDAVSQITDINRIQIICKEALPFYMPKMIIQDAVLFGILDNHFRHARRQSFFASNLYLWYETLNYPRKTPALIRNLWLRLPFYHSSILFFY